MAVTINPNPEIHNTGYCLKQFRFVQNSTVMNRIIKYVNTALNFFRLK